MLDRSRGSAPIIQNTRVRRGDAPGGGVADRPRYTLGGQGAAIADDPRFYGATNDDLIRRDRTAWFPSKARSGVGTVAVDWTMAAPYRPELHMRNVTVRTMVGTSQTRAFANPLDPSVGLHTNPKARPSGNIERFKAGASGIRPGRTDRLSPARYSGQSYSQTTLEQGARR